MFVDFRERGRGKERERNIWLTSLCAPMGNRTHNLGMSSDGGLNLKYYV